MAGLINKLKMAELPKEKTFGMFGFFVFKILRLKGGDDFSKSTRQGYQVA